MIIVSICLSKLLAPDCYFETSVIEEIFIVCLKDSSLCGIETFDLLAVSNTYGDAE